MADSIQDAAVEIARLRARIAELEARSTQNSRLLQREQRARAEAEAARRRVAFLAEASVALASTLDPQETLNKLTRLAVPILGDFCLVDVIDPDGVVRRVTEAAIDPAAEVKLRQSRRVYEPSSSGAISEVLNARRTQLIASIDGRALTSEGDDEGFERMGGSAEPIAILMVPLVAGARTLGAIIFGTTQKERAYSDSDVALAEEFARRASIALDNASLYQDAKEASRLKDDFLAVVSHELRTPLMPILGWSQLLKDPDMDGATRSSGLSTIERNARAQARLIDDLLDVSRIISGKLRLETRRMALGVAIEDALESVRPAAKAKNIKLTFKHEPDAPRVMGDPTRLQQIVWNLVSNAIKFTPAKGQVEVALTGSSERAVISVTDSGEGISADFIPHLFQRFRQAEAASTRKHGGLGLGLSIVRHLVELHGGTVSAQSAGPGQGAVFTVSLPAATQEAPEEKPAEVGLRTQLNRREENAPPPPATRLDGLRILVVEDQPDTLDLLIRTLSGLGAKVVGVASTADALKQLAKAVPDLIVSDIGMPGEDGYILIERIRAMPPDRGGLVPAIALTAFARAEDRLRVLRAGFQSHVAKPVEPVELSAVIASLARAGPVKRKPTRKPRKGAE